MAHINVVLRTPLLYVDANDQAGRLLRFAYQALSARRSAWADVGGIRVVPSLHAAGGGGGSDAGLLADCAAPGAGGIGDCEALAGMSLFPGPGQSTSLELVVQVYYG